MRLLQRHQVPGKHLGKALYPFNSWSWELSQRVAVQMETLIKDTLNVTCGPDEGENAGKRIMYIELDVVCPADTIMEMAMNGLNVVLAFLTALTVGKLLYDFYAYRKTGQLPWLATKLP